MALFSTELDKDFNNDNIIEFVNAHLDRHHYINEDGGFKFHSFDYTNTLTNGDVKEMQVSIGICDGVHYIQMKSLGEPTLSFVSLNPQIPPLHIRSDPYKNNFITEEVDCFRFGVILSMIETFRDKTVSGHTQDLSYDINTESLDGILLALHEDRTGNATPPSYEAQEGQIAFNSPNIIAWAHEFLNTTEYYTQGDLSFNSFERTVPKDDGTTRVDKACVGKFQEMSFMRFEIVGETDVTIVAHPSDPQGDIILINRGHHPARARVYNPENFTFFLTLLRQIVDPEYKVEDGTKSHAYAKQTLDNAFGQLI